MIRLIISFYLMLFFSLAIIFFSFFSYMSLALPNPFANNINQKLAKGTLTLLNDELQGLDAAETELLLKKYQQTFGQDLSLMDEALLSHLVPAQKQVLNTGDVIFEMIENPIFMVNKNKDSFEDDQSYLFYYYKQKKSSKIWRVHFDIDEGASFPLPSNDDETPAVFSSTFLTGMMSVIQSKLTSTESKDLQVKAKNIQARLGLPIHLVKADTINLQAFYPPTKKPYSTNPKQRVYRYTEDNGDISLVQHFPDSELALKVGPFEVSWFTQHIDSIFIITPILGILSTFLLGIWPLWSNLIKIKKASAKFGKGDYSARVIVGKFSPIKTISKAFNTMAEQTQDSMRSQKELTSAVSHELRTPLSRMHFSLESLEQTQSEEEKSESIIEIKEDIVQLNSLIDELLHYARYDQKKVELNPTMVNLNDWFSHTLERLEPLARNKTLHYSVDLTAINDTFSMDARLMSRVLDNLTQNALRYAQSKVVVSLSKESEHYLMTVEDDGEGIPENKRQQVFEAFSRIDSSRNRKTGGYGLGLAIVDKIITAHQGTVLITDSQQLAGARFEVRLPLTTYTS